MNDPINYDKPIVEPDGLPQQRLLILMHHPDYSLDKAFNGKGDTRGNRNDDLNSMSELDLLLDARKRIIEEIEAGNRMASDYTYSGFMCWCWKRAIDSGLIEDVMFNRENYVDGNSSYNGKTCLRLERATQL